MHRSRTAQKLGIPRRPATGERAVQFAGQARYEGKLDASRKLQIAEPEALQQHEDDEQREREIDDCRRIMLVAMIQAPMRAERVEAIVLDVPPPMACGATACAWRVAVGRGVVAQYQDLVSSKSCHCQAMCWRRCVVSTACSTRSGSLTPSQDVKPSILDGPGRLAPEAVKVVDPAPYSSRSAVIMVHHRARRDAGIRHRETWRGRSGSCKGTKGHACTLEPITIAASRFHAGGIARGDCHPGSLIGLLLPAVQAGREERPADVVRQQPASDRPGSTGLSRRSRGLSPGRRAGPLATVAHRPTALSRGSSTGMVGLHPGLSGREGPGPATQSRQGLRQSGERRGRHRTGHPRFSLSPARPSRPTWSAAWAAGNGGIYGQRIIGNDNPPNGCMIYDVPSASSTSRTARPTR